MILFVFGLRLPRVSRWSINKAQCLRRVTGIGCEAKRCCRGKLPPANSRHPVFGTPNQGWELSQTSVVTNAVAKCLPALEVETKPILQGIRVGDRVKIVSERQGEDLVWQVGVADVANAVGCVVKVAGRIHWFCNDELVLVEATAH